MAAKKKATQARAAARNDVEHRRLWLMYPPRLIQTAIIWELGQKFALVTNVRQASVNDEIGIVCLELSGRRTDVKSAIKWLEKKGVNVEPVEINVIES